MAIEKIDMKILSLHGGVRFPHFPREEYEGRLRKVKGLMGKYGMDGLLLFAPEDLYYYMGFKKENMPPDKKWRSGGIIPKNGEPVLLMDNLKYFNAVSSCWVKDIRGWGGLPEYGRPQNFLEAFVGIIKELDLFNKTLGLELWENITPLPVDLTWKEFDELKSRLPEAKMVDAGDLIWEQRMIKTPYEIKIIRELSVITNKGFRAGLEAIREGVSEKYITNAIYDAMLAAGLWNQPVWGRLPIRGPGHYHAGIMGPQETILKKGDMLMFDGGPCHKGYWSDIQRNACIGEPPALQRKLYDASLAGLDAALAVIRPGIRVGEIHRAALEKLQSIDPQLGIVRNLFAGHGQGLHTHEPPYLDPSGTHADMIVQEGMYLAVEISAFDAPAYKVIGGFPEDNVLVTNNGCENLSESIPRHLWIA